MSRFNSFTTNIGLFINDLKPKLSIDFGSYQTKVMVGQNLVWDQPTLLAWHSRLQAVVAVGDKALKLRGKTPAHIKLISPISQGVIAQLDFAELYLKSVLSSLGDEKKFSPYAIISCRTALPVSSSPLEKDQFRQTLKNAGIGVKQLLSKPAALISLASFRKMTQAHGVIDLGDQTTDVGIFAGTQHLKSATLTNVAGHDFTQAIVDQVLSDHNLEISWTMAEQIKHQLVAPIIGISKKDPTIMTVRGKYVRTHEMTVVRVAAREFEDKILQLSHQLLSEIKEIIDELPTEVITQLQEQGFYLTGGSSQLSSWLPLIEKTWQMPVIISKNPQTDVVKGLANGWK
jgi:rod shape-determining protein MreB and related proteins